MVTEIEKIVADYKLTNLGHAFQDAKNRDVAETTCPESNLHVWLFDVV